MIDAHAHLTSVPDLPEVAAWIVPGVSPERDAAAAALAGPRVAVAVGLHPWYLPDDLEGAVANLEAACDARDVVAIGETGLDKGRRGRPMDLQRRAFHAQLSLAARRGLPVILHVVRTHGACVEAAREAGVVGMVHDFAGPTEMIRDWVDAGFFLSVSPRGLSRQAAIRGIPGEHLLIETDDEGPERLSEVCREVARIRGVTSATVAAITAANARRLFRVSAAAAGD